MNHHFRRGMTAVERFDGFEESILSGDHLETQPHYRTPPSISGNVRLVPELYEITRPINFLNLWMDDLSVLVENQRHIVDDTVLVGRFETLSAFGQKADIVFRPVFYHEDRVAVRCQIAT